MLTKINFRQHFPQSHCFQLFEIFRNSFYCHLLFNYQCSFLLSRDSSFRLSHLNLLVNNFFKFFYFSFFKLLCRSQRNLYYHVFFKVSTPFFKFFQTICTIQNTTRSDCFSSIKKRLFLFYSLSLISSFYTLNFLI